MAFLGLREKLAVLAMLLLLATFASLSYASRNQKIPSNSKKILIHCVGAVAKETHIEVACGTMVSDLLAKLDLTADVDLSKIVLEERLKSEKVFVVPSKGKLSLYVTGAVEKEGVIYVPEGLHFNHLKQYLFLAGNADVACFKRRRRALSEGETVHIPPKMAKESEFIVRK